MEKLVAIFFSAILVMCCGSLVRSDAIDHHYKAGDLVPLYANKVGPLNNPSETYRYFDLPFCFPVADYVIEKKETLGEVLNGDRLVSAPYKLEFLSEKDSQVVCRKNLTKEEVSQFRNVIKRDYYFQFYLDDLPLWGFIGMINRLDSTGQNERYLLFKHLQFEVLFNKDRVIGINLTNTNAVADLTEDRGLLVDFVYTVIWKETDTIFEDRMKNYLPSFSSPNYFHIHWNSLSNSFVTILFLTGCLVAFYMRVLKKDFMEHTYDEVLADDQEEKGWKYILGDVFRYPNHKSLFAVVLGSGTQLFTLTILILILGLVGVFYPCNRGNLLTALVVIYAITSGIAGYTSTFFYCQLEGENWARNLLLTGCLSCGPLLFTFCSLNTVAIAYKATAALPFGTILLIVVLWIFVAFPLLVLGGIAGKNRKVEFQAPCHTTKCPRDIPPLRWYRGVLPQMALAGILPFSVIFVELSYIFTSVWGYMFYILYDIIFVVFIILLIVTALVTVALTYFQLAAEDHKWWWRSFLCGGSTGLYVFGYCFYYYYARADMSGFLQISFFFGYMACISCGIFLMLGTVGFLASLLFVRHIYGSIKCD
uniref:Transmembrane 9 superfamily member n=1 Tax=Fagus sylvatica TaxID=28930 RepID=A0A2N9EI93_FAGSY